MFQWFMIEQICQRLVAAKNKISFNPIGLYCNIMMKNMTGSNIRSATD
jgi:hypothetical protein